MKTSTYHRDCVNKTPHHVVPDSNSTRKQAKPLLYKPHRTYNRKCGRKVGFPTAVLSVASSFLTCGSHATTTVSSTALRPARMSFRLSARLEWVIMTPLGSLVEPFATCTEQNRRGQDGGWHGEASCDPLLPAELMASHRFGCKTGETFSKTERPLLHSRPCLRNSRPFMLGPSVSRKSLCT